MLPTLLAGSIIAPLLLELRMLSSSYTAKADEAAHEHASADVRLADVDARCSVLLSPGASIYSLPRDVLQEKNRQLQELPELSD